MSKNHSSHSCTLDLASHPSNPCYFDCTSGYTLNADATACVCALPNTVDPLTNACVYSPPVNICGYVSQTFSLIYADSPYEVTNRLSGCLHLPTVRHLDANCVEPIPVGCYCLTDIPSIIQDYEGSTADGVLVTFVGTAQVTENLEELVR